MRSDEELVREAQGGSRDAFAELVRRHEATLQSIARARLRNGEEAREVAQQAVVRAFLAIRELKDASKLRGWLGRMVQNLCIDELRRREVEERRPAPAPSLGSQALDDEILGDLDPLQRTLVALRFVNDLTYQETADWLDLPVNKVKWELHRAFETLRHSVRRES